MAKLTINTGNADKLEEFRKLLNMEVVSRVEDLPEPEADAITIIRYKASQFEEVLVDDTSLDIEGAQVGINVKWYIEHMKDFVGKKANFICMLGIHRRGKIHIFRGDVPGKIVEARGKGFGFNPYFLPEGSHKTLAEEMQNQYNARYHAVQAFLKNKASMVCEPLKIWKGHFQSKG